MRFEQPKTYDTFVNDKKALGINAKANELKRSMTNYFSDPDDRYDNRIREANADNNAEMVDAINSIRAQYDAQVPLTQKVFGDKEVVEQKGVDALKQISAELKRQGKGSLVNADGNVLFKNKAGELVDLDQGILKDLWHSTKANKGSIMAGVGGALLAPVTGGSSLLPVIAGGAVGSALGAAGDYVGNANDTGQNVDTGTLANLMLENAGFSVLGDGVGYAVAKGGKALINKAGDVINKSKTLKDSLGNEIENVNLKQKAVNILNNTPLLGDVTSANHAPAMGDITRSIKAADAVLSPEELAEKEAYLANNKIELNDINTLGLKAKAYADDYANRTSSPWVKDKVTKAGEYVENKAKGTLDPQITKEQEIALNNAFADPSEMKTIADVIGSDDLVRNKAIKIIDDQAQKRLEAAGINKNFRINPESFRKLDDTDKAFVSDILGSYVNATKSDYNQVVDAFKQVAGNSPLQIDKKGLDDAINSIVANYAKVEDRDKMRIALDQMAQEGFNINKAFDVRRYLNKAIRNSDYTGEQQARALKEVLDDSMFKSLGDDRGELRALLKEQDEKYAQMKALKDTKIFNKGNDLLSDDFNFDKVGDLINKNNDVWAKTTKGLNKEQIAEVEKAYIRSAIKDELVDLGMNRKGFNPIAVAEKLSDAKFVSDEAKTLQKALFDDAKFRPNTKGIIDAIDAGLKTKSQGGSIATSFSGKVAMAFVARSFERLAKHIPLIGKQAGKKNLYAEAFLKAKTTSDALTDIMKNEAIPIKDRFDLLTQTQSKEIRSLIDDFMAKKEQAKSELIKMDATEGNPKNTEIKGENFITKQSLAPKSDLNVKISVDDWVRELSEINNNELSANLFILQNKHPEFFKKPSDVYRLLKEIKNNPTHFFKNNRPDMALIVKVLEDGGVGKLGIVKESGYVGHLSKSTNKNEMDRLRKVNEKELKVGTPYPTLQRADINQVGPTAGAKSTFSSSDESIIPQKDKNTKTINASPHIASGLLGGTANGADENGNVSPEEFAKGFIYALFGSKFSASAVKRISPELYNSILGLGKKMPQMAKDNPKLLTKIYGSAKSNSINSFAGEKALNASANKLSKAKAMLEKGEDEVKIWQSTGWYKDKDGVWKFEIDDNPAKIKNQNADKLGDLLEHKELFKAYPELKDINVVKIKDELYNKNLKDWHKESSPLTKNTDGTPKIFYHGTKKSNISEFDQKFDKSKWGFFFTTDKGLSEEYSKGRYGLKEPNSGVMEVYINAKKPFDLREEITNDTAKKYQALLGNLAKRDDIKNGVGKSLYEYIKNTNLKQYDTKARAFKDKLQNAGYDSIILDDNVIVAFNPNQIKHVKNNGNFNKENDIYASGNKGYYDPAKKEIGLREIADKSTLMHEIQHAIQDIEGFAKGSNTNDKKYALSHGEAEARNVQNRLNLNKKDRVYPHETFDVNPNDTFVSRKDGVNFSKKLPELKEKRGIYNVTYNGKFSTPVYKDLTTIDDAIKYAKGDKSKGAKHISIRHLNDESKEGYVTRQELLSLGENIRAYLKENKEPFIDKRGGHIYEWEDKDGVRFRAVIGQAKRESDDRSITSTLKPTDEATKSGIIPNSSLYSSNDIITFYSDRNLKEPMKFENPKLKLLDAIDTSSDKVGLVKKVLLNKDISDGVKAKAVNRLTKNKISQATKTSYTSTKNSDNN